jgi:hypothetical protein
MKSSVTSVALSKPDTRLEQERAKRRARDSVRLHRRIRRVATFTQARRKPTNAFDQAAQTIPLAELYALFADVVTHHAVRKWRRGGKTPIWALDRLLNRLQMDVDAINQGMATILREKEKRASEAR